MITNKIEHTKQQMERGTQTKMKINQQQEPLKSLKKTINYLDQEKTNQKYILKWHSEYKAKEKIKSPN